MRKSLLMTPLAAVLFLLGASIPAHAGLVTFDFNTLADAATSATIQSYMNTWLTGHGGGSVTVGAGAVADRNTYNASLHIEGGNSGSPPQITLGNSEGCTVNGTPCVAGAVDTYVRNIGDETSPNDRITMLFSGLTITNVSFDYQIFPDGSLAQPPDFTFNAKDSLNAIVTTWTKLGVAPGVDGGDGTTWTRSPSGAETNAQRLGHWSGAVGSNNVVNLEFIDWPATIGVDNLTITTSNSAVPEPASMLLLGTGLAGLYTRRKKRQAAA